MSELVIRNASKTDREALWKIIKPVIRAGDTYVFSPDSSEQKIMDYWLAPKKQTYVAELEGQIVGTYWLVENQPDQGNHIANAAYIVSPEFGGRGIGKQLCKHSKKEAVNLGFSAIQFNFVLKSNENAVHLWQKLGFKIIGEIPEACQHVKFGFVNAYIMYQKLN